MADAKDNKKDNTETPAEAAIPAPDQAADSRAGPDNTGKDNKATSSEETPTEPKAKPRKRKAKRSVSHAQIHVLATFNNTIITVTDIKGNVLTSASAGGSGFRGSKKGTAYAAQIAAEKAISDAKQNYGIQKADVSVKGVGLGREAAIRSLANQKIDIDTVKDVTALAHGGTRARRPKRN
jgi:small subunit ribosomal protein S11